MKLQLSELREEVKKYQQEVRDLRTELNAVSRTQAKKLDIIIQYVEAQSQVSSEVLPPPASTEEELSELMEHCGLVSQYSTVQPWPYRSRFYLHRPSELKGLCLVLFRSELF